MGAGSRAGGGVWWREGGASAAGGGEGLEGWCSSSNSGTGDSFLGGEGGAAAFVPVSKLETIKGVVSKNRVL